MDKIRINLYDILLTLSNAIDLVTPELSNHHQQVAYLAYRLAEQMELPKEVKKDIIIEGLLHDIGALSTDDRLHDIEDEPITMYSHAFRGAKLLEECPVFHPYAKAVRYHHVLWDYGNGKECMGEEVPLASHLLHLADRVSVLVKSSRDILTQVPDILSFIKSRENSRFAPEMVNALMEIGKRENIWLEIVSKMPLDCIPDMVLFGIMDLELDDVVYISQMFSHIIDFQSHSTATHSAGVAKIAEKLGEIAGFSKNECKNLLIAGYFHDLGKLAIEDSVLEKPSQLNKKEYNIIRSHTFYTYQLLSKIKGFETINQWASYHHEKLNGNGYPFHLKEDSIPLGSRIVAVADIFTAITEKRSYRKGMSKTDTIQVLHNMVENGSICDKVVTMLIDNFDIFNKICEDSQIEASTHYSNFFREE